MKTSFYFVLWIVVYIVIDIFGSDNIRDNSFFVALIIVWGVSYLINRFTVRQRAYMNYCDSMELLEIIHNNDLNSYLSILRKRAVFQAVTFLYFLITVIFLIMVRDNLLIIAIFAFFGYAVGMQAYKSFHAYNNIKKAGQIIVPDCGVEFETIMNNYNEARTQKSFNELCAPPALGDKVLRWTNLVFAIMSILLGVYFITTNVLGLLSTGAYRMGSAMFVAYGGLALIYGVNDLVSAISGYSSSIN